MTKVHPSGGSATSVDGAPTVLTVWRKSLLLNFEGFAAFDGMGDLVFRVDDYPAGGRGAIVLMNGTGKPLFTARQKMLSLGKMWRVYEGEEEDKSKVKLSMKKGGSTGLFRGAGKVLAMVKWGGCTAGGLVVEGSYERRSCEVFDEQQRRVAEIRRKEAAGGVGLGADVFSLLVEPGFDAGIAMALVLLLEQMFGHRWQRRTQW